MDVSAAIGADASGMPRLDDGIVDVNGLLGTLSEAFVNEIANMEVEDMCAEGNWRNGYLGSASSSQVRSTSTCAFQAQMLSYFPEDPAERYGSVASRTVSATGVRCSTDLV